ncbi:MAG TPA: hypothetical protein DEA96_14265 [Leptospiraceae bacterium]|nr:hypothetical protein [Spirochaetaceae bacterium]HBS06128.1 hypothetical protein [Leptospiraceae bacterium]|tara:strand:+ start:60662 stop:61390 length:729 start_codon:yes stop_codon:yes gene_type:complete
MIEFLKAFSSSYERRAQLFPAVLVAVPLFVLALLFGIEVSWKMAGISLILGAAIGYLMATMVAERGRALQTEVFAHVLPTTVLLRHSDDRVDVYSKARYHSVLSNGTGLAFPNMQTESQDQRAADAIYASGVEWLKEQTRDTTKFAVLFKKLTDYGFVRNVVAIRNYGIALDLITLAFLTWVSSGVSTKVLPAVSETGIDLAFFAITLHVLWWFLHCRIVRLRRVGFEYGRALLRCCDNLGP